MIERIFTSILVGIVAGVLAYILGAALESIDVTERVGEVIISLAPLIGVLAGLWNFITGRRLL